MDLVPLEPLDHEIEHARGGEGPREVDALDERAQRRRVEPRGHGQGANAVDVGLDGRRDALPDGAALRLVQLQHEP